MHERDMLLGLLRQILVATERIRKRMEPIHAPEDFMASEAGLEKLDAICLHLAALAKI